MTHPLAGNLNSFKDTELESKIQDLTKKYFMTINPSVQMQISLLLDEYRSELATRRDQKLKDEYQKRDKDLDNLINVN